MSDCSTHAMEPKEKPTCNGHPCETIKRQARRIRELMGRSDSLERLASDMLVKLDGMAWHLNTKEQCMETLKAVEEYRQRLRSLGVEIGD